MLPSELLADESKWTQYANARDVDGVSVDALDERATCFCVYGALTRCGILNNDPRITELRAMFPTWISEYNDSRSHAEVVSALKSVGL